MDSPSNVRDLSSDIVLYNVSRSSQLTMISGGVRLSWSSYLIEMISGVILLFPSVCKRDSYVESLTITSVHCSWVSLVHYFRHSSTLRVSTTFWFNVVLDVVFGMILGLLAVFCLRDKEDCFFSILPWSYSWIWSVASVLCEWMYLWFHLSRLTSSCRLRVSSIRWFTHNVARNVKMVGILNQTWQNSSLGGQRLKVILSS